MPRGKKTDVQRQLMVKPRELVSWLCRAPLLALEAVALRLFWLVMRAMPVEQASEFGAWFLRHLGPRMNRHGHVKRNLAIAHPDYTPPQIEAVSREMWAGFGEVMSQFPHLEEICGWEFHRHVELVIKGELDVFADQPKPAIFVGAHLSNWELSAAVAVECRVPLTVVFTPERNPLVARMVQDRRQALGCGFISKSEGVRPLVRELIDGRSLGFVIDRRNDQGERVSFFGKDTQVATAPAKLALRFGVQLIPVRVEKIDTCRYRVSLHSPIEPNDEIVNEHERARDMMCRVFELFENWIEERPGEWFCSKRMWPKKPEHARTSLRKSTKETSAVPSTL